MQVRSRRRWQPRHAIVIGLAMVAVARIAAARSFEAEGTDTGAGIGARYIALGGALVPVKIESSNTGKLSVPFPFAPTAGLGWRSGYLKVDFAVYAHVVMSMNKDSVSPAADLSVSLGF